MQSPVTKETIQMKISKQVLLMTLILFIFFASGCSRNPLVMEDGDSNRDEVILKPELSSEFSKEKITAKVKTPPRLYEKPEPRSFASAKQGMPGNGSSGSFNAKPFSGNSEVFVLSKKEEVRRQLAYSPSDHLQDIHFTIDKFVLGSKSREILQNNAAYLMSHPNIKIEIQGHCDERGSNNYNITLGNRRTQSTKSYLVSLGVDENRIHTMSYGEESPFCFESNEKCWYQNRRAHFLVAE